MGEKLRSNRVVTLEVRCIVSTEGPDKGVGSEKVNEVPPSRDFIHFLTTPTAWGGRMRSRADGVRGSLDFINNFAT